MLDALYNDSEGQSIINDEIDSNHWDDLIISEYNNSLQKKDPAERVEWALEHLPPQFALSSSFGIQSAVSLHMVTQIFPEIPVVVVDTSYLFPETYQFIEQLQDRLNLNLKVFRADLSSGWQEARYGRLWENGVEGLTQYNQINKVEPMEFGLDKLNVKTWFSGIMRSQSESRSNIQVIEKLRGRFKVHPLFDWNKKTVHQYLVKHNLPYHPLWEKGYVSVGDTHSTVPLSLGMREEDTRFGGLKRECGLHEDPLSGL